MQPWIAKPSKLKQAVATLADGLNQAIEPTEIKDGQCVAASNVDSLLYPTLQVVEGHTLHSQHTGHISHIFKFKDAWYCTNGKGMYKLSGTVWSPVYEYSDVDNNRQWESATFFDGSKLYFFAGGLLRQWDGSSSSVVTDAPAGEYLATHSNRFFLANKSDNLLYFSGLRDVNDWKSTDKYVGTGKITVETPDGEKPSGLTAFANHVILFKRNTMHKLFGEDSTNFNMTQPYGVGCISKQSIVPTRDSLYWLGPDGFYDYMGGAAPTKISEPIRNYIRTINMEYAHNCCAGTDGRFVYLSLVTGTSVTPNVTLKYDMQGGRWWPVSFIATSFFLDGQTLYFGTTDGQIMKMGGNVFVWQQIPWSIETKPFSEDDESVRKTINRLTIVADVDPGATLNVAYAAGTEGGTWNQVYTSSNGSGDIQSIRIPVIVRTPETWYRLKLSGIGRAKVHRIIREVTKRNG